MSLIPLGILAAAGAGGAGSFESIATVTATTTVSSLTFSSIPSTYQHLQIRGIGRDTAGSSSGTSWGLQINGQTGIIYTIHRITGTGSAVGVDGFANQNYTDSIWVPFDLATSNTFGATIIDIHDYASTTKNKTIRVISGVDTNGGGVIRLSSGLFANTNAVSSITINQPSSGIKAGSTFALYGIKGA